MSIAQLSPNSVNISPSHINSQIKADQAASIPQAYQDSLQTGQKIKTDSIVFSHQAVRKLVNDVHSSVQNIKNGAYETASNAVKSES